MNPLFKDSFHAEILPVPEGVKRPLWSVLIPTYNCAGYLWETLASVLIQDPGEDRMEIIVVDDHSTEDDPELVVKEMGKGRVRFIRQEKNVGKVKNYETGLQLSTGRLIHQLHGDDKVRPGFYTAMEKLFDKYPNAGAAFCQTIYINEKSQWTGLTGMEKDEDGILMDFLPRIYSEQRIQTPSVTVKRLVYENLGGFDKRFNFVEDWEMWIRIACFYPFAFIPEVLAEYRSFSSNTSNRALFNGLLLKENRMILKQVDSYIDQSVKVKYSSIRRKKQALSILISYRKIKHSLKYKQKIAFLKRILELDCSVLKIIQFFRN